MVSHESLLYYNGGYEKCSAVFLTIGLTMVIHDSFSSSSSSMIAYINFCTIENRNEYSTMQA